jgi:hypothetical protein
MADLVLHNDAPLPFHAALSWKGIIQQIHNNIKPRQTVHFDIFGGGYSDFAIRFGDPQSEFTAKQNWVEFLALGVEIGGAVLTLATLGAGSDVAVAADTTAEAAAEGVAQAAAVQVSSATMVGVVSGGVTVVGFVGDIAGQILRPATIVGVTRGRNIDMRIDQATLHGELVADPGHPGKSLMHIDDIDPARLSWTDQLTHKTGSVDSGGKADYPAF